MKYPKEVELSIAALIDWQTDEKPNFIELDKDQYNQFSYIMEHQWGDWRTFRGCPVVLSEG